MHRTNTFLCVDPGKKYFGWVLVDNRIIVKAGLWEDNRFLANHFPGVDTCVCESQFSSDRKKVADILDLARAAGEIAGQFPNRVYIRPTTQSKTRFQEHGWNAMIESERNAIAFLKKSEQYHVKDAASIAMKYLGRLYGGAGV